jgi:hypothetical protein
MKQLLTALIKENVSLMNMNGNMLLKELMEEPGLGVTRQKVHLNSIKYQLHVQETDVRSRIIIFHLKSVNLVLKEILLMVCEMQLEMYGNSLINLLTRILNMSSSREDHPMMFRILTTGKICQTGKIINQVYGISLKKDSEKTTQIHQQL